MIAIAEGLDPRDAAKLAALSLRVKEYFPSSHRPSAQRHVAPPPPAARTPAAHPPPAVRDPAFVPHLAGRIDASRNFLRSGGRLGHRETDRALLAARTDYFRATYASSDTGAPAKNLWLLHSDRLKDVARALYDLPEVVPFAVYANVMVPGQELGVHTDVPVFRGANRRTLPTWLLAVMRHSGLYEERRIQVATVILYVGDVSGGEFVYYPGGTSGDATLLAARDNSAVAIDADTVFHGVDRVHGDDTPLVHLRSHTRLHHHHDTWELQTGERHVARYTDGDVRLSISWKAYCFADAQQHRTALAQPADLTLERVVRRLLDELRQRGRAPAMDIVYDRSLAHLLIDEFISFPPAPPGPGAGSPDSSDRAKQLDRT